MHVASKRNVDVLVLVMLKVIVMDVADGVGETVFKIRSNQHCNESKQVSALGLLGKCLAMNIISAVAVVMKNDDIACNNNGAPHRSVEVKRDSTEIES